MSKERVVIAGAGHAGGTVAAMLRQYGFEGSIALIGEEPIAPYQRPPLSKAWLKGEADAESLMLRPESWYAEGQIDLRLSTRVEAIDRAARTVTLSDGSSLAYDHLVMATGARARRLPVPGADADHVGVLRSAADAEWLKHRLGPGQRLAVIGGGYVGLEAAASARALGAEAVIVEREARVLARVAGPVLSDYFQSRHEARGVAFELSANVAAIEADGVRLADGRLIAANTVLVGIGAYADLELAQAAGLECSDGVVVDLDSRTSDPAVFAVGDMTHRPLPLYGRSARLESVPSALEQAKQAASALCGRPRPADEVPWFWSDQDELKLQIAGLAWDCDTVVERGDRAADSFALFHLKDGVVRAVEAVNAAPEFMGGRQLIGRQIAVDPARLADASVPMKALLAGPA